MQLIVDSCRHAAVCVCVCVCSPSTRAYQYANTRKYVHVLPLTAVLCLPVFFFLLLAMFKFIFSHYLFDASSKRLHSLVCLPSSLGPYFWSVFWLKFDLNQFLILQFGEFFHFKPTHVNLVGFPFTFIGENFFFCLSAPKNVVLASINGDQIQFFLYQDGFIEAILGLFYYLTN